MFELNLIDRMKKIVLFMTPIILLCMTINAQKQSNKTLVAYFSATGTTKKQPGWLQKPQVEHSTKYSLPKATEGLSWH